MPANSFDEIKENWNMPLLRGITIINPYLMLGILFAAFAILMMILFTVLSRHRVEFKVGRIKNEIP